MKSKYFILSIFLILSFQSASARWMEDQTGMCVMAVDENGMCWEDTGGVSGTSYDDGGMSYDDGTSHGGNPGSGMSGYDRFSRLINTHRGQPVSDAARDAMIWGAAGAYGCSGPGSVPGALACGAAAAAAAAASSCLDCH